jgi:hypothetical protein
MRALAKIAVVLLFSVSGFAQRASFTATAWQYFPAHYRGQLSFAPANDSSSHHGWYWEGTNSTASAAPIPFDRSAVFSNSNDFSPVSVCWTFSGKHPLMPSFEVVGFDVKPGSQLVSPDAQYGFIARPRVWNRAGHALVAALRY